MKRIVRAALLLALCSGLAGAAGSGRATTQAPSSGVLGGGLIQHVVIIFQENHSFDELLGGLCIQDARCDSVTSGVASDGTVVPLHAAPDIPPNVLHSTDAQTAAIDGGKMDAFDKIRGCGASTGYACYEQYRPDQIPNLAAFARRFGISDRTFETGPMPSWGGHLVLVASDSDGFVGENPKPGTQPPAFGWGCDSFKDTWWRPPTGSPIEVPSCVPAQDGSGPYRASPVQWEPTIMDRFDAAGLSWEIDTPKGGWSICPYFADCLYTPQAGHVKFSTQVVTNAQDGTLPNLSIVIPCCGYSQHNGGSSMLLGDDWIGRVVGAIMDGPEWDSTAIFITYDDCGCFYDHVPPPPGLGIRVPMVIVAPYARPAHTDSNVASFASMLAFTEHVFGLAPLGANDAGAYDYSGSFDFTQKPLQPIHPSWHDIPSAERAWLRKHPVDPNDPT